VSSRFVIVRPSSFYTLDRSPIISSVFRQQWSASASENKYACYSGQLRKQRTILPPRTHAPKVWTAFMRVISAETPVTTDITNDTA
jgi:hypothetical protein